MERVGRMAEEIHVIDVPSRQQCPERNKRIDGDDHTGNQI